jgi:hypothetical protein
VSCAIAIADLLQKEKDPNDQEIVNLLKRVQAQLEASRQRQSDRDKRMLQGLLGN